jgi:hypothetical protein
VLYFGYLGKSVKRGIVRLLKSVKKMSYKYKKLRDLSLRSKLDYTSFNKLKRSAWLERQLR